MPDIAGTLAFAGIIECSALLVRAYPGANEAVVCQSVRATFRRVGVTVPSGWNANATSMRTPRKVKTDLARLEERRLASRHFMAAYGAAA